MAGQYVIIEDFFPSILEIAGIKNPVLVQQPDGKSFVPLLKNSSLKDNSRELVWHHPNRWITQEGPNIHWSSAFRKGDWKLIYDYRKGKLELYNLKTDIGETKDIASQNPAKVKELAALFTKQLRKYDVQWPTFKATGKEVPWPDEVSSAL